MQDFVKFEDSKTRRLGKFHTIHKLEGRLARLRAHYESKMFTEQRPKNSVEIMLWHRDEKLFEKFNGHSRRR